MGQSLVKNYVHIVFSTKLRMPWLVEPFDKELHKYLGGLCKEFDSHPIQIGGWEDHVHVLCNLSKNFALSTFVGKIKCNSSKWIKPLDESLGLFYWQDGYGAFSVTPSEIDGLAYYIANQKAHHLKQNFQEEYLGYLHKYEIEYDERYVWD